MAFATSNSIMGAHVSGEYSSAFEIDFVPTKAAEVGNPRKHGIDVKTAIRGKVTPFVMFAITTRSAVTDEDGFVTLGEVLHEVDRRYSDFDWLMKVLAMRYSGLIVGTMPEKRLIDSNSDNIIAQRVEGLTLFLNDVLQNPYLEDDVTVQNFLALDKDSFDAYKDHPEEDKSQLLLKCPGLAEWYSFLETLQSNRNSEAALGTLNAEFTDLVKSSGKTMNASKQAVSARHKMLTASEKFGQAAQALVELNGVFDNELTFSFGPKSDVKLIKRSLNGSSRILQHAGSAIHEAGHLGVSAAETLDIVNSTTKRDRLTMLTFQELLKQREQLKKKHEHKRQDRMRKDLQYKTLKKQGRFEDAQKLEQILETIKTELDADNEGMALQAKGMLASEMRRYANRRFFELRRRMSHFADEQVAHADKNIEHWQNLLKNLQVDQERMSDIAENSLLHGRIETLEYNVHPNLDSVGDQFEDAAINDSGEDEEEEEEEEEEEDAEYEVEGEDEDDEMGLDGGAYDDEGDESQEDEL